MNILAVSDKERLITLREYLEIRFPKETFTLLSNPLDACRYGQTHPVDLLFAELSMKHANGLHVAKFVRMGNPEARICLLVDSEKLKPAHVPEGVEWILAYGELAESLHGEDMFRLSFFPEPFHEGRKE